MINHRAGGLFVILIVAIAALVIWQFNTVAAQSPPDNIPSAHLPNANSQHRYVYPPPRRPYRKSIRSCTCRCQACIWSPPRSSKKLGWSRSLYTKPHLSPKSKHSSDSPRMLTRSSRTCIRWLWLFPTVTCAVLAIATIVLLCCCYRKVRSYVLVSVCSVFSRH